MRAKRNGRDGAAAAAAPAAKRNGRGGAGWDAEHPDGDAAWLDVFTDDLEGPVLKALPSATLLDVACVYAGWWAVCQRLDGPGRAILDAEAARKICGFRMKGGRAWIDPSATVEAALPPRSTMRLYADGRPWATIKMRDYVNAAGMEGEAVKIVGETRDVEIPVPLDAPWTSTPAGIALLKRQTIGARELRPLLRSFLRGRKARQPGRLRAKASHGARPAAGR